MFLKFLLTASCVLVSSATALNATSIADCPALRPRSTTPKDVTDLRVDDIKIMGSLGDSIMAGYAMMNVGDGLLGLLSPNTIMESRGLSYMMGVDPGAVSVASFIKRYNPNLHGPSTGNHIVGYLNGNNSAPYYPYKDYLNAAQTGAMAINLNYELDYLIPRLIDTTVVDAKDQDGWKLINIHIGSNDMCRACDSTFTNDTTPEVYGNEVEKAILRIQSSVPKVLVNLIGMLNMTVMQSIPINNPDYCSDSKLMRYCSCFNTPEGSFRMNTLQDQYDEKLKSIAEKYAARPGNTFGVTYTPNTIDLKSFPTTAFSNIDCFHPSIVGHQWLAKAMWNQLFVKKGLRPSVLNFNFNEQVYCPIDSDRIIV